MHFGITEKPTTDCVSLHNNAVLTSKVYEKYPGEKMKIAALENSTVVWHPSPVKLLEYESIFVQIFVVGSERHIFTATECVDSSRSSKVIDFSTNRKGVFEFLLVTYSNFGPILHRFWDTTTYWLKIVNFSYPTLI